MRSNPDLKPEPIFNIIDFANIDFDALERDYHWSVIECDGWKARNRIVRGIRPDDRVLAIKNDGKEDAVYIMGSLSKDEIQNMLEDIFGKEELKQLGTVRRMQRSEMFPYRVVQILLNSMNRKSMDLETNAEGRFYKVIDRIRTKDVRKDRYGQLLVMEIETVQTPESMHQFGNVMVRYRVKTLNNILRPDLEFKPSEWKNSVFRLDDFGIHTGCEYSEGDMFIAKAVYDEKAHLDLLNWGKSKEEKNLNQSRSVLVLEAFERLERRYGKYLGEISFARCEGEVYKSKDNGIYHDEMIEHFREKEVRIFNQAGPEYRELVDEFVKTIEDNYGFKVSRTKGPGVSGFDIPVILRKDKYGGGADPHGKQTGSITQHVTVDTIRQIIDKYHQKSGNSEDEQLGHGLDEVGQESNKSKKEKKRDNCPSFQVKIPEVETIFEQLFIKEDLENDAIRFYHWSDKHYPGDWTFARPVYATLERRKRVLKGYAYITIDPDGRIKDKQFRELSDFSDTSLLSRVNWEGIDYAVINPEGMMNLVSHPGVSTIADGLSVKRIIEANNRKCADYAERTKNWTDGEKERDRANRPKRAEGVATNASKMKHMGGCIGVGYYKLSETSWIYYVGAQNNPNQAIANASWVYLIKSVDDSEVFFNELFPMMTVPFVKHEQNSVIPFPVQYLKEWCKRDHPELELRWYMTGLPPLEALSAIK